MWKIRSPEKSKMSNSSAHYQGMKQKSVNGVKDLSNYGPLQILKLLDVDATRIYSVGNEITEETLVVTSSPKKIIIYCLILKDNKNEMESSKPVFELKLVQTIELPALELSSFAISSECSITLPPKRLAYAVAPKLVNHVYCYSLENAEEIPDYVLIDEKRNDPETSALLCKRLFHAYPVIKMAMQGEKFLASVLENRTVVVWDLPSSSKFVTFPITSHGVHIAWHTSEPYKLMVVEANGWVKFFNVYKQSCFMTFYTAHFPLYCADWAITNSLLTTVGWPGGFTIINTSQTNSNLHKSFEVSQNSFSRVQFSTTDDKMIATLTKSPGVVRLWRQGFMGQIWSHNNNQIQDITWVHGKSFVLALGHLSLHIYEASDD